MADWVMLAARRPHRISPLPILHEPPRWLYDTQGMGPRRLVTPRQFLTQETSLNLEGVARTPSSALGSTPGKPDVR